MGSPGRTTEASRGLKKRRCRSRPQRLRLDGIRVGRAPIGLKAPVILMRRPLRDAPREPSPCRKVGRNLFFNFPLGSKMTKMLSLSTFARTARFSAQVAP